MCACEPKEKQPQEKQPLWYFSSPEPLLQYIYQSCHCLPSLKFRLKLKNSGDDF
jgi:hypothetical protein